VLVWSWPAAAQPPSPPHTNVQASNLLEDDPFLESQCIGNNPNAYEVVLLVGPLLAAYQQYTSAKVVM